MANGIKEYVNYTLKNLVDAQEVKKREPLTIRPTLEVRGKLKFMADEFHKPLSTFAGELLAEAVDDVFAAYVAEFDKESDRLEMVRAYQEAGYSEEDVPEPTVRRVK